MSLTTAVLMPLVLLLPAASSVEPAQDFSGNVGQVGAPSQTMDAGAACTPADTDPPSTMRFESWPMRFVSFGFQPENANQVRIEQRMTIRISPRSSPVPADAFMGVPNRPIGPRFVERKMGSCIPIASISGVQANGGNNLLLFLSDRRIVSADLDRSCRARDFYSGFYLSGNNDGRLCVKRDTLQSRSGAHCQLTRIRRLVEVSD